MNICTILNAVAWTALIASVGLNYCLWTGTLVKNDRPLQLVEIEDLQLPHQRGE